MSFRASIDDIASPSRGLIIISTIPLIVPSIMIVVVVVFVVVVVVESEPSIGAGSGDDDAIPLFEFDAASGSKSRGAGAAVEPEFHERIQQQNREKIAHRVTMLRVEKLKGRETKARPNDSQCTCD